MNDTLLKEIESFGNSTNEAKRLTGRKMDTEGYKVAIQRAAVDLTARTLARKDNVPKDWMPVKDFCDEKNEQSLINRIEEYFRDDPLDKDGFDDWHEKTCKYVLTVIQKYYSNRDDSHSPVCYGKAQKVINMTLKGCYCLDGATDKKEHFKYCHVALDTFTLAWYNRNQNRDEKCKTEWSKLSYDEYKKVQDKIRGIKPDIDLFKDLTPLEKEFLVWRTETMISTVTMVNKCIGGLIREDYAKEYFERHGLKNDLHMANIILGFETPDKLDERFVQFLKEIPKNQSGKRASGDYILEIFGADASAEDNE